MEGLASLVTRMRLAKGPSYQIPNFDPLDGGTRAEVLFLLEAPGPKAVSSGFVSRNNPDQTASNFFLLNAEAGLDRRRTVTWNAVPWYIGSGTKIRAAKRDDVRAADRWLQELLGMLAQLHFVVFVGQKALHARELVRTTCPEVECVNMPHPSPLFINHAPANRGRVLAVLKELSTRLTGGDA